MLKLNRGLVAIAIAIGAGGLVLGVMIHLIGRFATPIAHAQPDTCPGGQYQGV